MEENTIETIPGDMSKMHGFKTVCMKLGVMMIIIFLSRGIETVLLSAAVGFGMFDGMSPNMSYLFQTVISFLFLYIIPMVCAAALLKPPGMCARVYKKPKFFSSAMGMFPAFYGLALFINLLTMLVSKLFENTDLYKSFNTVNDLAPDNLFCAGVLLFQLVIIAPLFEEFWFRGIVMESLRPYGNGFAIFVSGILFGMTHANFSQFFYATVIGICLGYIAVSTDSIVTTTIMHAMFNGISGLLLLFITFDDVGNYLLAKQRGEEGVQTPIVICYLIFCFIVIMLMIIGMLMAIVKIRKIKRYKVPKMWEVTASKRWGVFFTRATVIIALVLAADTFTYRFAAQGALKLMNLVTGQ